MTNHIKISAFIEEKMGMLYILKLLCLQWPCGYVIHIKTSMFVVERTGSMLYIRHRKIRFRGVAHCKSLDAK